MRIYLATWIEDGQGGGLTKGGCEHRLLSFYFIRKTKITDSQFVEYMTTGTIQKKKKERSVRE